MTQSTAAMMKQKTNNPLPMLTFEHTRDAYGFAVRPQHLQRYREYASIYTEEEDERFVKWKCFLKKLAESAQPTTVEYGSSDRMCIGGLEKGVEEEDSSDKKSIDGLAKERPTKNEIKTSNSQRWTQIRPPLAVIKHMMTICDSKKILSKQEQTLKEELEVLVHGGVPMALRGEVWKAFLGVLSRQDQKYYEGLQSAAEKWKDLPRTFPGHPALDEDGRNALRRLLTAYARHNPSVGDCQAMNFFAGLLVLLMPEENAFWALLGIMDVYLEGYFSEEMIESQVDQLVLEELVRERFPELVNHLDYLGVEVTWVTGPWFIFLFVNVLPWESVLRIWDVLLFEGNRVMLFRISLALMDLYGPDLVTTKNIGDAITLLQSLTGSTFNSSQLVLTACTCYNEVNEAQLQELRDKYRPSVMAAVEEKSQVIDAYDSQGLDLQEQVVWLKRQLSKLIEEKQCAIIRAEELEITVKEMVLEDNAAKCKIDCLEKIIIEAEKTMEKEREQLEWELGKKYPSRKSEVSVNDNFIGGLASILQTELFEKYMSSYQREVDDEQVDLNSFSAIIKWDRRYPQHSLTSRYTNLEASSHMDVLGCKVDKSSIMVFPCASSVKRNKIILIASVACGFHYQIRDLG